MSRINVNTKAKNYFISCIDTEAYEVSFDTEKERLQFIWNTFQAEKVNPYELKRNNGNLQRIFQDWLAGLPSVFSMDFENYKILQIGKDWGLKLDSEKRQDEFLESWFPRMATAAFGLFRKHKIG